MRFVVHEKGAEKTLIATERIIKDTSILIFERNFLPYSTNKTLRINQDLHQLSTNSAAAENFVNHSCEPTAYIDWETLELRAIRDIEVGEEINYNYFTSDFEGEDIFECRCGTPECKKILMDSNISHSRRKRDCESGFHLFF